MRVKRDGRSFTVDVTADGAGLVSHAGAALLAEVADRVGLTRALSRALAGLRERRAPARSGPGDPRSGGDARRRRRLPVGPARGARSAAVVRAGRVGLDGVSADRPDRQRPGAAGGAARGARASAGAGVGAGRAAGADRDRYRRDADRRAHREGRRGGQLQGRLRVSPAAGLPGREPRGAGRDAAPGQRRRAQRRRSDRGARAGARAAPARGRRRPRTPRSCCAPTRPARRTSSARPRATRGSASWSGSI